MDGHEGDFVINKKFVTESELEERRKKRQEEWEKVRKPDDPEECPEEVHDPRSLYEKLQEQKDKKQEYEEQFKFKNMVRGLDEDETNFLAEVSRKQELLEKQRRDEEKKELNEFRNARTVAATSTEHKKSDADKKPLAKPPENKNKFSQSKLLAGAVRHKSNSESSSAKKIKLEQEHEKLKESHSSSVGSSSVTSSRVHCPSASICIGILPGLGAYSGSSDSESSSDSEATINNMGKIVSSVFRAGTFLDAP